jgi:hypothetical protein
MLAHENLDGRDKASEEEKILFHSRDSGDALNDWPDL